MAVTGVTLKAVSTNHRSGEVQKTGKIRNVKLDLIRIDGDTQVRVSLDQEVVQQYSEHMLDGDEFPPVIVFWDEANFWLADGFHRYFATKNNNIADISAEVNEGTLEQAQLFAYSANSRRGLSITDEDNRSIITKMLNHPVWGKWTNAEIARHVGVSKMTVGRVKQTLEPSKETKKKYTNKHGQKGIIETKNLGRVAVPEQNEEQLSELTETILAVTQENQLLKDKIAVGQWDASDIEKIDIQETVNELREKIRVLEIDNTALRESRDMFQSRNAEMMRTISSLKAKVKKLEV